MLDKLHCAQSYAVGLIELHLYVLHYVPYLIKAALEEEDFAVSSSIKNTKNEAEGITRRCQGKISKIHNVKKGSVLCSFNSCF